MWVVLYGSLWLFAAGHIYIYIYIYFFFFFFFFSMFVAFVVLSVCLMGPILHCDCLVCKRESWSVSSSLVSNVCCRRFLFTFLLHVRLSLLTMTNSNQM